ncbi:hypothetical protein HHI36_016181 [Cryptolaemus montrouzieri]|uniref:Trafficking protein particle complex subunit n=1 Tax=Cryptolaemus montrouzieri TaxID=559131 RepID=A0ABD2NJM9_9CUCU
MTVHDIYIFNKSGNLLYYHEWNRLKQTGMTREEEAKLMYGMLFLLNHLSIKFLLLIQRKSLTGLKFVLNTDIHAQGVRELLQQIYNQVYVEYVVKNPLLSLSDPIESEIFKTKLDSLIKQSPVFLSKVS